MEDVAPFQEGRQGPFRARERMAALLDGRKNRPRGTVLKIVLRVAWEAGGGMFPLRLQVRIICNRPNLMKNTLSSLIRYTLCAVLALSGLVSARAEDKALSATGTWTWSMPGRDGGPERKFSLALVQDGEKLTGKVTSPGRDGAAVETEIAEASVKGADITFSVTREWNGNKRVAKYTGKLTADAITGKIESKDRDGKDQSRDWSARKEAAKG